MKSVIMSKSTKQLRVTMTTAQSTAILFKYSAHFHRLVGLWPENDQPLGRYWQTKCRVLTALVIGILIFNFSGLTKELDKNHWPEFILNISLSVTSVAKVVPLVIHRNYLLKMFHTTLEIHAFERNSWQEKQIANKWLRLQTLSTKCVIVAYMIAVLMYCIISLFNENNDKYPLKGVRPEAAYVTPWSNSLAYAQLLIFFHSSILKKTRFCAGSKSFTFLSELQIVQYLMATTGNSDRKSLLRVIERHQIVLDYGHTMCKNLTMTFLLQYLCIATNVLFSGIIVLYIDNAMIRLTMTLFTSFGLLELYIICLVGEVIKEESTKVVGNAGDIYVEFLGNTPSIKLIYFVLLRGMKPLRIKMGSSVMDLQFYNASIKRLYSFFMVLKTLVE